MKRYYYSEEAYDYESQIIVGTDREIRSLYRKLEDRWTRFIPSHCDFPKFREGGMYGIEIDNKGIFSVLNSDTLCKLMLA